MPEYQKLPLTNKKHAVDGGPICKNTDSAYKRIAADLVGVARELRRARTAEAKRDVMAALFWQADSIRRVLLAEQKALLHQMAERPQ